MCKCISKTFAILLLFMGLGFAIVATGGSWLQVHQGRFPGRPELGLEEMKDFLESGFSLWDEELDRLFAESSIAIGVVKGFSIATCIFIGIGKYLCWQRSLLPCFRLVCVGL